MTKDEQNEYYENKVAQLEKENNKLESRNDKLVKMYNEMVERQNRLQQSLCKDLAELKQENAELKEKFTKAKEIIKMLHSDCYSIAECEDTNLGPWEDDLAKAEQFLSEVSK